MEEQEAVLEEMEAMELRGSAEGEAHLAEIKGKLEELEEAGLREAEERERVVGELVKQNGELLRAIKRAEGEREAAEGRAQEAWADRMAAYMGVDLMKQRVKAVEEKSANNEREMEEMERKVAEKEKELREMGELEMKVGVMAAELEGLRGVVEIKEAAVEEERKEAERWRVRGRARQHTERVMSQAEGEIGERAQEGSELEGEENTWEQKIVEMEVELRTTRRRL